MGRNGRVIEEAHRQARQAPSEWCSRQQRLLAQQEKLYGLTSLFVQHPCSPSRSSTPYQQDKKKKKNRLYASAASSSGADGK